ncbi:MAG TPA: DUF6726 family protein [Stellaceae bacterium]|nr:DUF6726 family protein [Stellaceae bacterium]
MELIRRSRVRLLDGSSVVIAMLARFCLLLAMAVALASCGVVAAPCRVSSGVIKAVPLVGDVAAAPTDACANVIDPDPISRS